MKIKIMLGLLLFAAALPCFAQKKPLNEHVNNIPEGRNILIQPQFHNDGHITGKITIDFTINRKGDVISAKVHSRGTTIHNKVFIHKCERAVMDAKFSELKHAPETQHGSLSFAFKGTSR
jgi:hypothetical protein